MSLAIICMELTVIFQQSEKLLCHFLASLKIVLLLHSGHTLSPEQGEHNIDRNQRENVESQGGHTERPRPRDDDCESDVLWLALFFFA